MNLKQIRFALAVAQEQNFTRAAQRCHTVQSALSHQIAKLEEELGSTLFERTSRQVNLTAAGRAFLAPAEQLLAAHSHLIDTMEALKGEVTGTLTVGIISTLNAIDVIGQMAKFTQRYPLVNIRMYVGMTEKLLEDVQQLRTDVAFVGIWQMNRWWPWSAPHMLMPYVPPLRSVSSHRCRWWTSMPVPVHGARLITRSVKRG